jgi:hypothetical protein
MEKATNLAATWVQILLVLGAVALVGECNIILTLDSGLGREGGSGGGGQFWTFRPRSSSFSLTIGDCGRASPATVP